MTNDILALAEVRKSQRPDLYQTELESLSNNKVGYSDAVSEMITDLKSNVPGISIRQISTVLGVGKSFVSEVLRQDSDEDFVPVKTNEEMCADELAALMATECQGYGAVEETNVVPLRLHAPAFYDAPRKADQSHLKPRPITLPTFPIIPLRIREAA